MFNGHTLVTKMAAISIDIENHQHLQVCNSCLTLVNKSCPLASCFYKVYEASTGFNVISHMIMTIALKVIQSFETSLVQV